MTDSRRFRVGLTRDFLDASGALAYKDIGLGLLDADSGIEYAFLDEYQPEITPEQAADHDALIVLVPRVTARTVSAPHSRLSLIARLGVGYDTVDVAACTAADVALTIAPDGVRRPVATAILTFLLALAQNLPAKERIARSGRWDERSHNLGPGLTGRTVGVIGVGNIGREFFRLAQPLEMIHLGHDPYVKPEDVADLGVRLVDLPTLLREADFVCINCPLTPRTRGLIGAPELALMKPTAYVINTARGPIIDEAALYDALRDSRIAGAALDVWTQEPTPTDSPLLHLDNVIATPHAMCWTDECFRLMGEIDCQSALSISHGEIPKNLVNRAVLDRASFRAKLEQYKAQHA